MRKLFALAAITSIILLAANFSSCNDSKSDKKANVDADSTTNQVSRGEYLANYVAGCMDCHSKRDFTKYSGPPVPGTEGGGGFLFDENLGLPGKIYSRNITPDNETGIGTWTDEDIIKALRFGISKRGDTLFPLMPYPHYNGMAKDDLMAIIAYLRTLKPISNKIPDRQLYMPISAVYSGEMAGYLSKASLDSIKRPEPSDQVKYGEYLVNMADCGTCHSPLTKQGPDFSRRFAGGYTFKTPWFTVTSANITSDTATGIGNWTEAQFLQKFTHYREEQNYNFNPGKENTMMPVALFAKMTDEDLKAIFAYLKTVPPIRNKVEKYPPGVVADTTKGPNTKKDTISR